MTSKPDSVSTLGYHWTDRTGRPLEPQVHWDATGTTLADASIQWCSSGDPVLICIIGTHWKTTGATSTLGCHWNHTGSCLLPVVSQWRSSVNLHNWNTLEDHWKATGKPLEDHLKHTGISPVAFQCTLGSKFQAHWIATGLPLEYHWLRVRGTTVSAASSWLFSLVFHIKLIYRLPPISFHDNGDSRSRDTIWPWKFKAKVQGQRYPSPVDSFLFCFTSNRPTIPKIWQIDCSIGITDFKYYEKISSGGKHDNGYTPTKFCSDWMSGFHLIVRTSYILSRFGSLVTLS